MKLKLLAIIFLTNSGFFAASINNDKLAKIIGVCADLTDKENLAELERQRAFPLLSNTILSVERRYTFNLHFFDHHISYLQSTLFALFNYLNDFKIKHTNNELEKVITPYLNEIEAFIANNENLGAQAIQYFNQKILSIRNSLNVHIDYYKFPTLLHFIDVKTRTPILKLFIAHDEAIDAFLYNIEMIEDLNLNVTTYKKVIDEIELFINNYRSSFNLENLKKINDSFERFRDKYIETVENEPIEEKLSQIIKKYPELNKVLDLFTYFPTCFAQEWIKTGTNKKRLEIINSLSRQLDLKNGRHVDDKLIGNNFEFAQEHVDALYAFIKFINDKDIDELLPSNSKDEIIKKLITIEKELPTHFIKTKFKPKLPQKTVTDKCLIM